MAVEAYRRSDLYVLRTGCQWRYLPSDFPPSPTVYYWFRRLSADGTWERVNHTLVMAAANAAAAMPVQQPRSSTANQ